jgi:hypothetical protein
MLENCLPQAYRLGVVMLLRLNQSEIPGGKRIETIRLERLLVFARCLFDVAEYLLEKTQLIV